ncbi:hypothetical protein BDB01DRAFT_834578 [Pilobolus umbonatus]|nr:hypothetical protein BDB01DRAFT_834578 [Pilobolus umbonatus]
MDATHKCRSIFGSYGAIYQYHTGYYRNTGYVLQSLRILNGREKSACWISVAKTLYSNYIKKFAVNTSCTEYPVEFDPWVGQLHAMNDGSVIGLPPFVSHLLSELYPSSTLLFYFIKYAPFLVPLTVTLDLIQKAQEEVYCHSQLKFKLQ